MHFQQWVSLSSAAVYLAIAVAAVVGAKRSPMAPQLGRTCAALFAYEAFETLKHVTGWQDFYLLECGAASLVAPTTAALVIQFLGEWRRLRALVIGGATYFSLLALGCLAAPFVPALRAFAGEAPWAIAMLAGMAPEFALLGVLLWRHARTASPQERARTQLLVLALGLGLGGASTDLLSIAGIASPRYAVFGLVAAAVVLAALAFRLELLERVRALVVANVVVLVGLTALLHVIVLSLLGRSTALATTLAAAITLAALATLRPIVAALSEERARTRSLVAMGRFSAQMAHDLRNPLAAIRGAAQFLVEEKARGGSLDGQAAFVELILEQADRLGRVVSDYQRLGRAEAVRADVDVAQLLEEVAVAQRAASAKHTIDVRADGVGRAAVDRDLVAGAIENLVRNAREASPERGHVVLGATRRGRTLTLTVQDDGPGMDARVRERAFDDFYTTKATGTGLGLAFVARVAEAHGGRARITSQQGKGTTIELELELAEPGTNRHSAAPA